MAGETAYQKIIGRRLLRTLSDGRLVLRLNRVWGHEITTPNAILDMRRRGCDQVFDPNKIKTMIDHVTPAKDTKSAIQGQLLRKWSLEHGIEFLDVGRNGVCHAIIPEKGWIMPGEIGIMGDSHTCTHGAFCALAAGVGTTELEIGMITGLWTCAPQKVIRVNFVGKLPSNVFAKDLILTLINQIGVDGATNAVFEFGGNVIGKMSMEARMTIANMAVEAGATSGMMMVDKTTIEYLWPMLKNDFLNTKEALVYLSQFNSAADAEYDQLIEIDVTRLMPVATVNFSPGDVVPVSELNGKVVDQVYIGSCTNGRIEDLALAAGVFRQYGKGVAKGLRCIIVPATQKVYEMALDAGYLSTFLEAGCFVSGPTCGACLGMSNGVLAPGEVCVSTTNRNFNGRMGLGGMVHLVSPVTAALTAITGMITVPSKEMSRRARAFASGMGGEVWNVTDHKAIPFKTPDYTELYGRISGDEQRIFSGEVFYLPQKDINTDQIIPAKYLTEIDLAAFGQHCLEDAPMSDEERKNLQGKKILVAGENFGCGSSREHAVWALDGAGIQCVIASSFARIFEQNMFANGLLCITLSKEDIEYLFQSRIEQLSVDIESGKIYVIGHEAIGFNFDLSSYQEDLIQNGGSLGIMLKLAAELQAEGKI
ncbi:MAG: aconitase/3-isopropylmalate dehydratase large subunit family protein [Parcubacteria group bacterium]